MTAILQASLPFSPWAEPNARRLPGVQPLDPAEWLHVDDAFSTVYGDDGSPVRQRWRRSS